MAIDAKTTLALAALALVVPAPEIREQPIDTPRTDVARMEWTGGSASDVSVEYKHGLDWVTVASGLAADDEVDGARSVEWQPGRESPVGDYRIRVEGEDFALVSDDFDVRPCRCVIADAVRSRWRRGRFRLRLTAEYAPAGIGGHRLLRAPVETGRPVVRVLREGRRVGSVRLRYRRGAFRGTWPGPRGGQNSVVFQLVALTDGFGNRRGR